MNRPIKFRARHKGTGELIYFSAGFTELAAFLEERARNGGSEADYDWMQFTGLTDKNGKEIYEGDILRHRFEDYEDWSNYRVVYEDAAFIAREIKPPHHFTLGKNSNFEVIGNVFENPELIEKSV